MKAIYARFVLWLIASAIDMREKHLSEEQSKGFSYREFEEKRRVDEEEVAIFGRTPKQQAQYEIDMVRAGAEWDRWRKERAERIERKAREQHARRLIEEAQEGSISSG